MKIIMPNGNGFQLFATAHKHARARAKTPIIILFVVTEFWYSIFCHFVDFQLSISTCFSRWGSIVYVCTQDKINTCVSDVLLENCHVQTIGL